MTAVPEHTPNYPPPLPLRKIPRHLMERWSAIDEEGIHLANIRIYHHAESSLGRRPRIVLTLPPDPAHPSDPDEYELEMVNQDVENQIVVAEREKEPGTGSRARTTILTGSVKHECNMRPMLTERYRQQLKARNRAANQPKRTTMRIEDAHPGGRGSINMLTSGATNHSGFNLVVRTSLLSHLYDSPWQRMPAETDLPAITPYTENKTEATKGAVRAHGSYAARPAARRALPRVPGARAVVHQGAARAHAAARGVPQGGPQRDRVPPPQRGVQRLVGTHGELQGRGSKLVALTGSLPSIVLLFLLYGY